jgi:aryl-alcohol dehydrogenase-like predicted oxidoreductase
MEVMASRHNVTIAQVALNWVINFHGETIVTIPGATRVSQAQESAAAMQFRLSADEMIVSMSCQILPIRYFYFTVIFARSGP